MTGDDFGLALPVNEAIVQAHQHGILTTASLMPGARFFQDAVARAKEHPSLRVGLHVTLVEGSPVLPPRQVPNLVDEKGYFSTHLARAGFMFFFYPGIRKQLEAEIRAQFEAFRKTGLALDHVNAHNHMQLHPTVLRLILKAGKEHGLKAVRLPNEPPVRSWMAAGTSIGSRLVSRAFLSPWIVLMKKMMDRAHVRYNDFLLGMTDSGSMTSDLVIRFLRHMPEGTTEMCFHPSTHRCVEIDATMPEYRHEDELRTLTSEALRGALQTNGIQTIVFSDL